MPLNKFTTLLDLARQAKILTGETATFDGKIQVGIPFSGYPTGVDTGSTVSLGVVSSEDAIFSGNTGTTVFDVSNPSSPNYNILFSGYTASTWSNPLFSANTSGLTLPITIFSADTQIVGPFWTLTQTGMTGDYVIGIQYTGYNLTYSFNEVLQIGTGITTQYSGFTTATQENFSAGTLDYKGPLDYLSTKEDATVEGRLITDKITITGGASSATTNYILAQTDDTGNGEWNSLSSLLSGTCHPLINLEVISGCSINGLTIESDVTVNGDVVINGSATTINTEIIQSKDNNIVLNYSGTHLTAIGGGITLEDGVSNGVDSTIYTNSDGVWLFDPSLSANNGTIDYLITNSLTANTIGDSGNCVSDLYVSNIHSCSPLNINPLDEGDVYFGSTSGVTIDVINSRIGVGKSPNFIFDVLGNDLNTFIDDTTDAKKLVISGDTTNLVENSTIIDYPALGGAGGVAMGTIGPNAVIPGIVPERGVSGDTYIYSSARANGLNIISADNPSGTADYIRLYAGQDATGTPDIHIQGSGATRGYVGLNNDNPQELLHTKDGDFLIETSNGKFYSDFGNVVGSVVLLSGLTNEVPRMGIQNNGSITMGIRGITDVSYPGYGKQGDSFIYSDTINNGINIISQPGTGTDDYIRFFAGQAAGASGTPDLYIQGSGATKGYVAVGHGTPTEKLDVLGSIKMVDGNEQNGYVLTSDVNGVGSWQAAISGDTTYWTAGTGTDSAVLIGGGNIASGITSVAEGTNTVAGGDYSHAEGNGTKAFGGSSHAEGGATIASGDYSHSEGFFTTASGNNSHSEGDFTQASGDGSHAEGQGTVASGDESHAEGIGTAATGPISHAEGQNTIASGNTSHAEGQNTVAGGVNSHAEGLSSIARGDMSHAEGNATYAPGNYSHSEGDLTDAIGIASHAEGRTTIASGVYSHAEGNSTIASGYTSHAEGINTVAGGTASHAEGGGSEAYGNYSHAEGNSTIASGVYSHSEGQGTRAYGNSSHAGGALSITSGDTSFIHSKNSLVIGDRSVILGGQNITGSTNDMVYVPDLNIVNCPSYDDDTAAGVGGLLVGEVFQTTGAGGAPLNVAGILMIKQ